MLWRLNAGIAGYSQIGKSIVAYICDESIVPSLMNELKRVLAPFRSAALRPPYAMLVGDRLPLSFRYGAFIGDSVTVRSERLADERSRRQDLANLPSCPFLPFVEAEAPDQELNRFLLSYPVFSVLGQAGKGGIYVALDIESPSYREVIVKLGRRNGNILPDGRDGMDLVRHEHWFYSMLQGTSLCRHVPALVHYMESETAAALVLERIEGVTLLGLAMDGTLSRENLLDALAILDAFHEAGYLVGDAKLANFILSSSDNVRAIDFESAVAIAEAHALPKYASFRFTDERLTSYPEMWEKLHFLYSVVHFAEERSDEKNGGKSSRVICLRDALASNRTLSPIADEARRLARKLLSLSL